ncbi:hypothetical protein A3B02_02035 [Candidatus Roizmanbacteria bacterium RIFCSPLOWO2_01_FULL_42_14]|uniref:DUF5671 domain-containing protein n=4 Tax=Candidatus Roizmaniibacteriota TaxID=1752723 RepID=A0A1F7JW63_9BACT|nr:MAG: hypothetical protein A3D08_00220 [Candidatus Roizmanbacteria bacterium RIFCSPHIGHO2_02_FULL_43_11]OGK37950.1 MAG: hypothetical protein A3F32_02200 [Candidatus Roizmanbacteria bacterium RIFCSPHIGHO2_12_FULL_42_10]OGK52543.1 MAG: hypothetical protein A3B02_02035 [Candidatus Roizmanbacteria bacterium RIFCSPLOWO2_01_FULL_42_14]OGK59858.1 MAG: hypothetical protein A3I56_03240 [Candidatus Roizmanbacteria bacterium RIFCSPLOWO2_02_FULL_43_10]
MAITKTQKHRVTIALSLIFALSISPFISWAFINLAFIVSISDSDVAPGAFIEKSQGAIYVIIFLLIWRWAYTFIKKGMSSYN